MSVSSVDFRVTALGDVTASAGRGAEPARLTLSVKLILSLLVAAERQGIAGDDLEYHLGDDPEKPTTPRRTKRNRATNLVRRLRAAVGEEMVPHLRPGDLYRLSLEPHQVDVWWLLSIANGPLHDLDEARVLHVLRPDRPYHGLVSNELLDDSSNKITVARRELLVRLIREQPAMVDGRLLPLAVRLAEERPNDEGLVEVMARLTALLGDRAAAVRIIAHWSRDFGDRVGLPASDELNELERRLLDGTAITAERRDLPPERRPLPAALASMLASPFVTPMEARADLTDAIDDPAVQWILVDGDAGSGRTRLCAEVTNELWAAGAEILHLAPPVGGTSVLPYEALASALPALAAHRDLVLDQALPPDTTTHRILSGFHQTLSELGTQRSVVIVVTDTSDLDSDSAAALRYLRTRPFTGDVTVVVAAGGGPLPSGVVTPGRALLDTLWARHDRTVVQVPVMDHDRMERLIRLHRPDLQPHQTYKLAHQVLRESAGLPGVAVPLIASLDETALVSAPLSPMAGDPRSRLVDGLSPLARQVGAVAAELGPGFRIEHVTESLGIDEDQALNALTELTLCGLVRDQGEWEFRLADAAAQAALGGRAPASARRRWHQLSLERVGDDVHRRARHLSACAPGPEAVAALVVSADTHLAAGRHYEAAGDYQRAAQLAREELELATAPNRCRALDLCGRGEEAEAVRAAAFERAVVDRRHGMALAIALSSIPEAEMISPHDPLLARLERLAGCADLTAADQHRLLCHHARQLSFAGKASDALTLLRSAPLAPATPEQRVERAVTERYAASILEPPAACLALLDAVAAELGAASASIQADYHLNRAVDAYEAARPDEVERSLRLLAQALPGGGAHRAWHHRLLVCTLLEDRGEGDQARRNRWEAADFGVSAGIVSALPARLAGELLARWVADRFTVADLDLDVVRQASRQGQLLAEAGAAVLMAATGEADAAVAVAEAVGRSALGQVTRLSAPSLAIVSDLLARSDDAELVGAAHRLLGHRGQVMLVAGAFVASLGPSSRYQANLESDGARCRELRREAVELARRSRSSRWITVTERDRGR